jgi:hypothetical protein
VSDNIYVNPKNSDRQKVRWYLGDTAVGSDGVTVADPLVTDLEIEFALQETGNDPKAAAAFCARYAAVKLLRSETQEIRLLDFSASTAVSAKDAADYYLELADRLEHESRRGGIYAGGLSVAEKSADAADTGLVQPFFRRGLHDYEG